MITLKQIFLLFTTAAAVMAQDPRLSAPRTDANARDFMRDYFPITAQERLEWVAKSTVGPRNLAAGLVTSAWGTGHKVNCSSQQFSRGHHVKTSEWGSVVSATHWFSRYAVSLEARVHRQTT